MQTAYFQQKSQSCRQHIMNFSNAYRQRLVVSVTNYIAFNILQCVRQFDWVRDVVQEVQTKNNRQAEAEVQICRLIFLSHYDAVHVD